MISYHKLFYPQANRVWTKVPIFEFSRVFNQVIIIMTNKLFLQAGAILGLLGVALGAFGAHALKPSLEASGRFDTFETAVKYQFYHALALILISILLQNASVSAAKWYNWAGYATLGGVIIFSGALYTICFTGIKAFGAVAPIGGTLMIVGWLLLFLGSTKS